jgi:hypothetical protein
MANGQAIAITRRPDFDREGRFVALRSFDAGKVTYVAGQAVDKNLFTTRRLRQLYEAKWLSMSERKGRKDGAS